MTVIRQPLLSPIRFYNPNLAFGSYTTFQNPDNRVSTGYNWPGIASLPYHLPIPKQWPDGQPGIDFLINTDAFASQFYAKLYDEDDADYKDLNVGTGWKSIDSGYQWRVWLDGYSGTGIATGYYTIKLFDTDGDALLLESEALLIAEWFDDMIPFEFWNFESDFGLVFDNLKTMWTGRMMLPVSIYDPGPTFEKEIYKDDPGTLTTLRTTIQREFNFDSLPVPVHVAETFQVAFACSELYLDRIKINSEDSPEAELIDGTNLKQLSGTATLVDFNTDYVRELVEPIKTDQGIDWDTDNYPISTITGNSISIAVPTLPAGPPFYQATSDSVSYTEGDLVLVKIEMTDDSPTSDLPSVTFDSLGYHIVLQWGVNWLSYRVNATGSDTFSFRNSVGERAYYTAVIDVYLVT